MNPSSRRSPDSSVLRIVFAAIALAAITLAGLWLCRAPKVHAAAAQTPPLDHPDRACRKCHQQIYDAYQKTPMALGSGIARDGLDRRELATPGFDHAASGIRYLIHSSDSDASVTLTYDRAASASAPALSGSERLQYFIGSGHRGRTFLFQQDDLWFETPINWYGKKGVWDMAPAFSDVPSLPPPLPVNANCLHCHAGEVQTATDGVGNHFSGPPFRAGGVGCAACHGSPTAHLQAAAKGRPLAGTILNPGKSEPYPRISVCLQCHLEGDATVFRPGQSLATFVPGNPLSTSAVYFVDRNRAQQGLRASSQYEALLRSACRKGAGDRLTCTTCHDPHSSPAPAERVAFFRAKCIGCHNTPAIAVNHHPEQPDCASCHMPTRKTLDISHEQLVDHNIQARPEETVPGLRSRLAIPDLVPVGPVQVTLREEGLAYAQLAQSAAQTAHPQVAERALQLLQAAEAGGSNDVELHNQLGFLLQRAGSPAGATAEYRLALALDPLDVTAAANLAVLDAAHADVPGALRLLESVVARDPAQTAAGLNLAYLDCRLGKGSEARALVERMLVFNPGSAEASLFLATGRYAGQTCRLP